MMLCSILFSLQFTDPLYSLPVYKNYKPFQKMLNNILSLRGEKMSSESSFTPFCFTTGVCALLSCCSGIGVGRDGGGIDVSSGLSDGF